MKILLLLLLFTSAVACQNKASQDIQGLNLQDVPTYHKVLYGSSGNPIYVVIRFPSETQAEIKKYYLRADMQPGTYSVDRASVSKAGPSWNLIFTGSDCAPDNSVVRWSVILNDESHFDYSVTTNPAEIFRLTPQVEVIYKVLQYNTAAYVESATTCD